MSRSLSLLSFLSCFLPAATVDVVPNASALDAATVDMGPNASALDAAAVDVVTNALALDARMSQTNLLSKVAASTEMSRFHTDSNVTTKGNKVFLGRLQDVYSWWTPWVGSPQAGKELRPRWCRYGFITYVALGWTAGTMAVGTVRCNDGTTLSPAWRKSDVYTKTEEAGFTKVSGRHNTRPRFPRLCVGDWCIGFNNWESSKYEYSCERGLKVAGIHQAMTRDGELVGLRFNCRGQGSYCGANLVPVLPANCSFTDSLPNCADAFYGQTCEGTGRCYEDSRLQNCGWKSVYVKERLR